MQAFYAESSDFRRAACSGLVRNAVPGANLRPTELALRLPAWHSALPAIEIAGNSGYHRDLFADAADYPPAPNVGGWVDLNAAVGESAFVQAEADYRTQPGRPWRNALHAGRALLAG